MDSETAIAPIRTSLKQPAVGIYRGMSADHYHSLDAASSHRLSLLARSPAHLRHAIDNPSDPSPAMVFGSMVHTAVLEPGQLDERFAVAPKCDRRTTAGKSEFAAFCDRIGRRTIMDADDYCKAASVTAAVYAHPAARALLDAGTETELSAVWECRRTGVLCKMRSDLLTVDADGVPCIADLKTTTDASPEAFSRSIQNFGYHRQASHYLTGLAGCGMVHERYYLISVETAAPFCTVVYRLSDEALIVGDDEVTGLLRKYAFCRERDEWPGYPNESVEISLPNWRMKQLDAAF